MKAERGELFMPNTIIDDRLQALGVTKNYKGYHKLKLVIELALEDEEKLYSVSKNLYQPIAEKCGCSTGSISRNIRTVIDNIWKNNYHNLCVIAGLKLTEKPTVTQFISLLVANVQRSSMASAV